MDQSRFLMEVRPSPSATCRAPQGASSQAGDRGEGLATRLRPMGWLAGAARPCDKLQGTPPGNAQAMPCGLCTATHLCIRQGAWQVLHRRQAGAQRFVGGGGVRTHTGVGRAAAAAGWELPSHSSWLWLRLLQAAPQHRICSQPWR